MLRRSALATRMQNTETGRIWLIDEELQSLQFGYQTTFGFGWGELGRPTVGSITIETSFSIIWPGKPAVTVDPAKAETLSPVLDLLHRKIARVAEHRSGLLEIHFADGPTVRVEKRTDGYESWNSYGAGELHDFNMLCSARDVSPWGERV